MKSTFVAQILSLCLISATISLAARPEPLTRWKDGRSYFNIPNIPGLDFFGGGFGFVCLGKGPCYKKKLTCPAKCFTAYSGTGNGVGYGGGGGSCRFDCNTKCIAYC